METSGSENIPSWTVCTNCGHPLKQNIGVCPIIPPTSALEGLLNFPGVPSASDALDVRVALEETKSDMEKLDEEICALESALAGLRSNREVLEKRSQRLDAVFAPVRRLPTDVLIQIFFFFSTMESPYKRNNATQLVLCHISQLWRAIALSTSSLWTNIFLSFPDSDLSMEFEAAAVQHRLTYSRDSPLYVDIRGAHETSPLSRNPALELLLLQSHRWKEASLWLTLDQISHYFGGVKGRLGKLERLRVTFSGVLMPIDYFEDAPNLRMFAMDNFAALEKSCPLTLPWDSLTHLKIEAQDGLTILQLCPSLVSCDLTVWSDLERSTPKLVELSHLRSFRVLNQTNNSFGWFYDSVRLPVLHSFKLCDLSDTDSHHIVSLLSRLSQTLERLTLTLLPSFDIRVCLEAAPRLKHLSIKLAHSNALRYISMHRLSLDLTSSTNTLLPELESMEFEMAYGPTEMSLVFNDAFVDMVLSRLSCKPVGMESVVSPSPCHETYSRLRSVMIVIITPSWGGWIEDPFHNEDSINFLRSCQDGGADVSVNMTGADWQIRIARSKFPSQISSIDQMTTVGMT